MNTVEFVFRSGLRQRLFDNVVLAGSWDAAGGYSGDWTTAPMSELEEPDGTWSYHRVMQFPDSSVGAQFAWGVRADAPAGAGSWVIAGEVPDENDERCVRLFKLAAGAQKQEYYLTHLGRLGANLLKSVAPNSTRFAVWAPNAQAAWVVLGDPNNGYIADSGSGVIARFPMELADGGYWVAEVDLLDATNTIYMFELVNDAGQTVYRTDLYSRCQVGSGDTDPQGAPFVGAPLSLDGHVSCAFVMDPAVVEYPVGSSRYMSEAEFWADEFDPAKPVPTRLKDLVIYELHVGALAAGEDRPGNLADAIALIPYLVELGVNAVELLPISQFDRAEGWGYGTTHFCAIEFSEGGPDHLKAFVKACHQQGIAVILDVVYNHYPLEANRAEYKYDSVEEPNNLYYWYEGQPSDYRHPDGGYIDNLSSGWAPAFHDENVRKLFTSSALSLLLDSHIDGFRVDQTTSIHLYPTIHDNGQPAVRARVFGAKFLREWGRSVRLVKPSAFLIAEDHSTWSAVTAPVGEGGMGFNARWYNDFYHHLIGDTQRDPNLLASAGWGGDWPLDMGYFAGLLQNTSASTVVFHESHDEAGNSVNNDVPSARTILVAVHQWDPAALVPELRGWAEARCRVVAGLSLLSAGVPMFLMGEEIGAAQPYRYNDWMEHREPLWQLKAGAGANLFKYYADLIRLRIDFPAIRSENLEVLHAHNDNRVLVFKRWGENSEALVIASLSNRPFDQGYVIQHPDLPDASWKEVFNSDAGVYGGIGYGNGGAVLASSGGQFCAVIPANGLLVFARQ